MAQAKNKTQATDQSVLDFLNGVDHPKRKEDGLKVFEMMKNISKVPAKMWGPSIIGFDEYHYKYESGREGDLFKIGFSPRKTALTIYVMPGFDRYQEIMARLGKYKIGKSCLYIKKLEDIDEKALLELIQEGYNYMNEKYS